MLITSVHFLSLLTCQVQYHLESHKKADLRVNFQIGTGGDIVGVKRTGAATFAAWSMFCTHQQCATNIANNGFDCPCHNSRFDSDGRVVRGPATRPLPSVATRYDAPTDTLTIG